MLNGMALCCQLKASIAFVSRFGCINANNKVSKGNQILGMIRRNITYKDKGLIVPLYKAIGRPHLEYCTHAWRPYLRKDIDMLDKIQR